MPDTDNLKAPENYWWNIAFIFTMAVGYALVSGSQLMVGAMMGIGMMTRYMLLTITGMIFALMTGMLVSTQRSTPGQIFFATRNVSFFPACFVAWLVTIITGMQEAAKSFAAENFMTFTDPFGAMVDPIKAGAIVLIVADTCMIPFLLRTVGEKRPLIKYETIVIIFYLTFASALKAIIQ